MAPVELPCVTVDVREDLGPVAEGDVARVVVWLRGEHDLSTVDALSESLAGAVALGDSDVVVDLSEVAFMSAATVGAIVRAQERLRRRSWSLTLRSPSPCARRVLDLCGLADLVDPRLVDLADLEAT